MYYWVRFTGERLAPNDYSGDYTERGWIDPVFSWHELFDNKNDGRAYRFDSYDEAYEFITDELGPVNCSDGHTFYAEEGRNDYVTGDYWNYAAHIETTGE